MAIIALLGATKCDIEDEECAVQVPDVPFTTGFTCVTHKVRFFGDSAVVDPEHSSPEPGSGFIVALFAALILLCVGVGLWQGYKSASTIPVRLRI